ncbi:MAG: hypothetical protein JHC95_11020 [Solirubrobacteraceae bacterium]|nr:hypothetical protein [Solirubrobacteraceae bacterium]
MAKPSNGHGRFSRSEQVTVGHTDDHARRLHALVNATRKTRGATTDRAFLGDALTITAGAFGGHSIAVALLRGDEVQVPDRLIRGRLAVDAATLVAALSLDAGEPVERPDGDGFALAFPMTVDGRPAAALVVTGRRAELTDDDRLLLELLATHLAMGMENLELRARSVLPAQAPARPSVA